jgi:hypothetical protein
MIRGKEVSNLVKARPWDNNNKRTNNNNRFSLLFNNDPPVMQGAYPCKKNSTDRQTDRHGQAHKIFFTHTRV